MALRRNKLLLFGKFTWIKYFISPLQFWIYELMWPYFPFDWHVSIFNNLSQVNRHLWNYPRKHCGTNLYVNCYGLPCDAKVFPFFPLPWRDANLKGKEWSLNIVVSAHFMLWTSYLTLDNWKYGYFMVVDLRKLLRKLGISLHSLQSSFTRHPPPTWIIIWLFILEYSTASWIGLGIIFLLFLLG